MSKEKDRSPEQILAKLEHPKLGTNFDKEELNFLLDYASERGMYNSSIFNEDQCRIIRRVLDRLFISYVSSHEIAENNLYLYRAHVNNIRQEVEKERNNLQSMAANLNKVKQNDK